MLVSGGNAEGTQAITNNYNPTDGETAGVYDTTRHKLNKTIKAIKGKKTDE